MSVKRYALDTDGDGYDFGDAIPVAVESPDGDYVRFDDYDALRRERDEAKEYGTRMRREWQRECENTNLLLQGLGLCPSEYRSEGGSLLLGRIQHTLWLECRDALLIKMKKGPK